MNPGRFIVVEGLEGAGKTTAIEVIKNFLQPKVPNIILTREPGGTRIGEGIRTLIKEHVDGEKIDAHSELLMMYAARVQLIEEVIKPSLAVGDWVIADRFELSSYAYQGGGRGIHYETLNALSSIFLKNFKPDLTFFLDIPPLQGLERVKARGKLDRFEQESFNFFANVYDAYHQAITGMDNVVVINASLSLSLVAQSIISRLDYFLDQNETY